MYSKKIKCEVLAQELKKLFDTLEARLYWLKVWDDLSDSEKGFIYCLLTKQNHV